MIHRRTTGLLVVCATALCLLADRSAAQEVLLDRPVRAGGLIFFEALGQEGLYYYAPTRARLASHDGGKPQFSLLRYVENVSSPSGQSREGEGGGFLHAVIQLGVTDEELEEARGELRRAVPGARIEGPVVFRSGKFGLVSSFQDEAGEIVTQVAGLGAAPVLDGGKAAVSLRLTKLGSKLVWQSFQTDTSNISVMFEMDMAGYRAPKRALIEADMERVYEHQAFEAGVATTYLQSEIDLAFDDLYEEGAIRLTQVGEDEDLDELVKTAYSKLTDLVFRPAGASAPGSPTGEPGGKSALDRASALLDKRRGEVRQENERIRKTNETTRRRAREEAEELRKRAQKAGQPGQPGEDAEGEAGFLADLAGLAEVLAETLESTPEGLPAGKPVVGGIQEEQDLPAFAAVVTYEMKRQRQRGVYRVDLNKYTADTLPLRFDENIGGLRRYLDDESVFRNVNLDDPLYRQRELVAFIDGTNASDFGEYINFVSLQMRKRHESGEETPDEVRIDRNNFNAEGNNFKLLYGWKGDNDRRRWLEYEYKAIWSFFGGSSVEEDWRKSTSGAINLTPPFQRREVALEADPDVLGDAGVRSITVKIFYHLGGEEQVKQVTLIPSKGQLSEKVEFMLPAAEHDYGYEISWRLRGNRSLSSGRQTASEAILFVDELPEDPEEG